MDPQTHGFYRHNARDLAARYRAAEGGVSAHFAEAFPGCHRILDVGCGAGTDVCRLLNLGHDALGADPCREMIEEARASLHRQGLQADDPGIECRVFVDSLPALEHCNDGEFDGVLCSAVLMHMPDEQLFDAVYGLRRVLRPGGRLLLSIPAAWPGIDQRTCRDENGRYIADHKADKLRLLLERVGFRVLWQRESADALGREGRAWSTLLLERLAADLDRPLDQVESILNRDRKDATYKLALIRALAEIAQTRYNVARFDGAGRVSVPLAELAERWLVYYWPLVASRDFIAQKQGEKRGSAKPLAIRRPLVVLIERFDQAGGLPRFLADLRSGRLAPELADCHTEAMQVIGRTIWNMPVRYAGGGGDFSVFGYDRIRRAVTMPVDLWREFVLTGSWIHDATILRWAELTARLSRGEVTVSRAVEKLMPGTDPVRETLDARRLYQQAGVTECVWTCKPLRSGRFDVDHVIPFALWRNNDLWNLLPTRPETNNQKRDRLPTQRLIQARREAVIGCWETLRAEFPERFNREAAGLCGVESMPEGRWHGTLFSRLAEAVELTAVQRCVPRWEPGAS
jgi:SAM-dependent methyltransferase